MSYIKAGDIVCHENHPKNYVYEVKALSDGSVHSEPLALVERIEGNIGDFCLKLQYLYKLNPLEGLAAQSE